MSFLYTIPAGYLTGIAAGALTNALGAMGAQTARTQLTGRDEPPHGAEIAAGSFLSTAVLGKIGVAAANTLIGTGPFIASAKLGAITVTAANCSMAGDKNNWADTAKKVTYAACLTALCLSASKALTVAAVVGFGVSRYYRT